MKRLVSVPFILFVVSCVLFITLLAYAATTVNVDPPGISVNKNSPWLYVNTSHPWSASSSHLINITVDYAHSVPNFISENNTTNISGVYSASGTEYLYSSKYNPPNGNHTVYASSDIEADYVTDQAWNTQGFSWP